MNLNEIEMIIKSHEGLKTKPYKDSIGKMTIGIGRNLDENGISADEAIYLMRNDIARCEEELRRNDWYLIQPKNVKYALIDMCFNMGIARLLGFKKMISALRKRDYTEAAREALDSKWASQVGKRATNIAIMIREGL